MRRSFVAGAGTVAGIALFVVALTRLMPESASDLVSAPDAAGARVGSVATSSGGPRSPARSEAAPVPPRRIVVVGDSVAQSLSWGLRTVAARSGIQVDSAAMPSCGVAAGFTLDGHMRPFPYSAICAEAFPAALDTVESSFAPDLVVWQSIPELSNRLEHGRALRFGTLEHDAALYRAMEDALGRLTVGGAKVVLLSAVPRTHGVAGPAQTSDHWHRHYNDLMRRLAERHPTTVALVDQGPVVCPGGVPCPSVVDGVAVRPDGIHFTEETSPWVAERLLQPILDAYATLARAP